jgi:1,6-anhydro-N-acetylmuramate kinase
VVVCGADEAKQSASRMASVFVFGIGNENTLQLNRCSELWLGSTSVANSDNDNDDNDNGDKLWKSNKRNRMARIWP